jgi:hypothetical protein
MENVPSLSLSLRCSPTDLRSDSVLRKECSCEALDEAQADLSDLALLRSNHEVIRDGYAFTSTHFGKGLSNINQLCDQSGSHFDILLDLHSTQMALSNLAPMQISNAPTDHKSQFILLWMRLTNVPTPMGTVVAWKCSEACEGTSQVASKFARVRH